MQRSVHINHINSKCLHSIIHLQKASVVYFCEILLDTNVNGGISIQFFYFMPFHKLLTRCYLFNGELFNFYLILGAIKLLNIKYATKDTAFKCQFASLSHSIPWVGFQS